MKIGAGMRHFLENYLKKIHDFYHDAGQSRYLAYAAAPESCIAEER